MKDPVVTLKVALHGHPDSGAIWEKHCETVSLTYERAFFAILPKKLLVVVYVDDFKLAGPKASIKEGWDSVSRKCPKAIGRSFGCMHKEEHNPTSTI